MPSVTDRLRNYASAARSRASRVLYDADVVLRDPRDAPFDSYQLLSLIVIFGFINGSMMGSYGLLGGGHAGQIVFTGIKVPLLLVVTFLLCLPSFYVVNSLLGLHGDFPKVIQALMITQSTIAIVLASLSPLTICWYLSDANYQRAIVANMVVFAVASGMGQYMLQRHYRTLIARNTRHRAMMRVWLVTYAIVGIQMGWILRPFIGSPTDPLRFFRREPWSNAYFAVWRILVQSIRE